MVNARYKERVDNCMRITGFTREQVELLIEKGFNLETGDLSQVRFWVAAHVPGKCELWERA